MTPDPMTPQPYRVSGIRSDTREVFTLELTPQAGPRLAYRPGQFTMLYQFGVGEVPISISGDPEGDTLVQTIRAVGGVTRAMARLKAGDPLGVRGPFGSHWPIAEHTGHDVVVMAGGLGLAPVRPILYHVLRHRDDYGRVSLLYGTRTPEDILYREELEQWRSRLDMDVAITVDRADEHWHGQVGVVTELLGRVAVEPHRTVAMVCGPEVMMRFSALALRQAGVSIQRIFLSMERNMKCAVGWCGHCQWGSHFVCKDGPVFDFATLEPILTVNEL